jgi:acetyl-CoA carboxylase carboxyltransferase component
MYPEAGEVPAAGVVTGIGVVHGRSVMVIANDATVKAGAFFPATCKKVLRAQKIAARCNLPIVYLVDSSGVYLPMQDEIFPDEDDFGRIFRNNAVLSAAGVPQFAAVMGNCVAGGAYLPVLCDKLLMTQGSQLCLAGPSLVKAAIGQDVDPETLGGARMHAQTSGTVDFFEKDDGACLARLRALVGMLPQASTWSAELTKPVADVYSVVREPSAEYDARDLLRCTVDQNSLQKFKADYGHTLVCAYARLDGVAVGVVANQRVRTKSDRGEVQIGGVIYPDAADKAARFVMDCAQTGLPLLFFQDVLGFMVGPDVEHQGIIRRGAKLVSAVSNARVPKITTIVGGSFGAGHYALCGRAFDPHFIFAWPGAQYAVLGPAQAATTLMEVKKRQSDRAGGNGHAGLAGEFERIKRHYTAQSDIRYGAARGWVDAIIAPHETRQVLTMALRCATRPPAAGGFRAGVFQV